MADRVTRIHLYGGDGHFGLLQVLFFAISLLRDHTPDPVSGNRSRLPQVWHQQNVFSFQFLLFWIVWQRFSSAQQTIGNSHLCSLVSSMYVCAFWSVYLQNLSLSGLPVPSQQLLSYWAFGSP